jgi:tRNA modification GTPase
MKTFLADDRDTIAAIATASGEAGIGIVRISGAASLPVADTIFKARSGKRLSAAASHTLHYGWVAGADGKIIDEALVSLMRAPRTFTREDVVEINCHGGVVVLRAVLDAVLAQGCRLAQPGEFTKRAFLNGRIDLVQAEAVADIIRAKTDAALSMSVNQLAGHLGRMLTQLRAPLVDLVAGLEAQIDFPDDDTGRFDRNAVARQLLPVRKRLEELIRQARYGRMLREGVRCVICGCPNVGKSSLLNALLKKERSIVTHLPGTTRDVIEEVIDIRGIPVRIMDTAGLLEPRDLIEKKAVARTKSCIRQADLLLVVFDGGRRLSGRDRRLLRLSGKKAIAVINKIDRPRVVETAAIKRRFQNVVELSARKMRGVEDLEERIVALLGAGQACGHAEELLVANLRQAQYLRQAEKCVAEALDSLDNKVPAAYVCQSLKDALSAFDAVGGGNASEEVLAKIFSDFCIGK